MSDLPYDDEYINNILNQRPDLQEKINTIIQNLQGLNNIDKKTLMDLAQEELEELIVTILQAFSTAVKEITNINDLTPEQQVLFFKQIEELSKVISGKGVFEDDKALLSMIVENMADAYINALSQVEKEPEFLTEADKKRIKEEMKRIAEYEIHKKLNPKQLAGETLKDNFLNNMKIGGIDLASKYAGKEFLSKIDSSEMKKLLGENKQFNNNFNVQKTSSGQILTPNAQHSNSTGSKKGPAKE